jgi:hypothetical protein
MDIAPPTRSVEVGEGVKLAVTGISAHGIAYLLRRFPALQTMMAGMKDGTEFKMDDIDIPGLVAAVPDAIAAIIAAGCGFPNNEEAEAKAATITAEVQLDLIKAIVELTMPKGPGPFFDKLVSVMRGFDVSVKDLDTPSQSQSSS